LTAAEVIEIRIRRDQGMTLRTIADTYGVRFQTIHGIVTRKYWAHIP